MTNTSLLYTIEGATAVLTLNRPERRNALSLELMNELIACLDDIDRNDQVAMVCEQACQNYGKRKSTSP